MKRRNSGQILALKRLVSLSNEHPTAIGFTLDQIASWPPLRAKGVERDSVNKAVHRFLSLQIAYSPGMNQSGKKLFRIINNEWANAYIEGDPTKPWLPLTPTPPSNAFPVVDEHKDHFDVELTREWFAIVKRYASVANNQYTWKHKSFTISVNGSSLKGQVYIRPYWRTDIEQVFGKGFLDYLMKQDLSGDFCLPFGVKGERISLGGRATQFSASHFPAQLDVQCKKSDKNVREGLYAVTDQAAFNIKVLDTFDALLETLTKQGEVQTRNTEALEKLVRLLSPSPELEYKQDNKPNDGLMYG